MASLVQDGGLHSLSFPTLPNYAPTAPASSDVDTSAFDPASSAGGISDSPNGLQAMIDGLAAPGKSADDGSLADASAKVEAAQKRLDAMKASAMRLVSDTPEQVPVEPAGIAAMASDFGLINSPHLPPHYLQVRARAKPAGCTLSPHQRHPVVNPDDRKKRSLILHGELRVLGDTSER